MINTISKTLGAQEEDPKISSKVKHEDRNQAVREIAKKQAHRGDRTLDQTLEDDRPDAPISDSATAGVSTSDRTLNK